MIDTPVKRGRPPGSIETTEGLIDTELLQHIKLYRQCREIVKRRIESSGDIMPPEELAKFMDLLRKGIVDMVKARSPASQAEKDAESVNLEEILATLEGVSGKSK